MEEKKLDEKKSDEEKSEKKKNSYKSFNDYLAQKIAIVNKRSTLPGRKPYTIFCNEKNVRFAFTYKSPKLSDKENINDNGAFEQGGQKIYCRHIGFRFIKLYQKGKSFSKEFFDVFTKKKKSENYLEYDERSIEFKGNHYTLMPPHYLPIYIAELFEEPNPALKRYFLILTENHVLNSSHKCITQ